MEKGKSLNELTEQQVREWLVNVKKPVRGERVTPVITISRELGSGGSKIAEIIKEKLGDPWKVWDKEILEEIQRMTEAKQEIVESLDEKSKSRFENFLEGLLNSDSRFFGIDDYKRNLVRVLLRIGHYGHAIILGRGANFILPNSFRVRVVASRRKRVEVLKKYEDFSYQEARLLMRQSDHEREEFVRRYFNESINSPWNYDLCIKTSYISPERAAEVIIKCAKDKLNF